MDLDGLSMEKRREVMALIAEQYYNCGKTQQDIANELNTTRFKIARFLQDARTENIVEIRINRNQAMNPAMEQALLEKYPLKKAIVVESTQSSIIDSEQNYGRAGARYLQELLKPGSTIGLSWGKTIAGAVQSMEMTVHTPLSIVQIAGCFRHLGSGSGSQELIQILSRAYPGSDYYDLNVPIYINDPVLRTAMMKEPMISQVLSRGKSMDVILSGIGGKSSLPQNNPILRPYISEADSRQIPQCLGSVYGFVLDQEGGIADIDLNRKLLSINITDILTTPHRIIMARGRHKVDVLHKALKNKLYNELITDYETASRMLEA
jgi:deoxyribonucleoside regulator